MSILQKQVIQSLDGLSDDNLQFLLDMILCFMKPDKIEEEHNDNLIIIKDNIRRIGSLEGQDLITIWAVLNDPKLLERARDIILDRENEIFYSTASVWEVRHFMGDRKGTKNYM